MSPTRPNPALDEQLKAIARWWRRTWHVAPVVLGATSTAIAIGYVGFIVAEFARATGPSHSAPLLGGFEEPALIATPIVGAAAGLASAVLRWRDARGWLGLLLNVGAGAAVLIACSLFAGMARMDH